MPKVQVLDGILSASEHEGRSFQPESGVIRLMGTPAKQCGSWPRSVHGASGESYLLGRVHRKESKSFSTARDAAADDAPNFFTPDSGSISVSPAFAEAGEPTIAADASITANTNASEHKSRRGVPTNSNSTGDTAVAVKSRQGNSMSWANLRCVAVP